MPKMPDHGWKKALSVFLQCGFVQERVTGSHIVLTKPGLPRPVILPKYKSLPKFIISNIIATAGIKKKDYIEMLKAGG